MNTAATETTNETAERPLLLGCGIFAKEIEYLIEKNHWPLATHFLPPSLHIDLPALAKQLDHALTATAQPNTLIFYGDACHPRIDALIAPHRACRVAGQNCVAMLLGSEQFQHELEQGTFFLLEDWARHWDKAIEQTFAGHWAVAREVFQAAHRSILALRTPCSGDYQAAAEHAAASVGLPLRWEDVALTHLEHTLRAAQRNASFRLAASASAHPSRS